MLKVSDSSWRTSSPISNVQKGYIENWRAQRSFIIVHWPAKVQWPQYNRTVNWADRTAMVPPSHTRVG